jgi:splicing factor 3A subunit 3
MDSILEVTRQTHEELERLERALYTVLSKPQPTHQAHIRLDHNAAQILDRISTRLVALDGLYADDQGRDRAIQQLTSSSQTGNDANGADLGQFYEKLKTIQDHHAKYPDTLTATDLFELELSALVDDPAANAASGGDRGADNNDDEGEWDEEDDPIALQFSGEEQMGQYLDLYVNHVQYTNIKNISRRPGYLQYLDLLLACGNEGMGGLHGELGIQLRAGRDYELYVSSLGFSSLSS